jgi:hypothetical protein
LLFGRGEHRVIGDVVGMAAKIMEQEGILASSTRKKK